MPHRKRQNSRKVTRVSTPAGAVVGRGRIYLGNGIYRRLRALLARSRQSVDYLRPMKFLRFSHFIPKVRLRSAWLLAGFCCLCGSVLAEEAPKILPLMSAPP